MGRSSIVLGVIAVILCASGGCSSPPNVVRTIAWRNPVSWMWRGREKAEEPEKKTRSLNPFRRRAKSEKVEADAMPEKTAAKTASATESADAKPDAVETAAAEKNATAKSNVVSFDVETLQLIEEELAKGNATRAERVQMFNDLKGQEPQMVRLILSNWRLARQLEQRASQQAVAHAAAQAPVNRINPAMASLPSNGLGSQQPLRQPTGSPDPGLGNASPWQRGATHIQTAQTPLQQQPNVAAGSSIPLYPGHPSNRMGRSPSNQNIGSITQQRVQPLSPGPTPGAPSGMRVPAEMPAATNPLVNPQMAPGHSPLQDANTVHHAGAFRPGQPQLRQHGVSSNAGMPTVIPLGPSSRPPAGPSPTGAGQHSLQASHAAGSPVPFQQGFTQSLSPNPHAAGFASGAAVSGSPQFAARTMSSQFAAPAQPPSNSVDANQQWRSELEQLISNTVNAFGSMSPGTTDQEKHDYIQSQVYLRMMYLMSGEHQRAIGPIRGIDAADQEFWQQVFWAMSSYFGDEIILDPQERAAQTVAQMREAIHRLQENAKLELRNVNFSRRIHNFGSYERFERDEFSAGQPVLIYSEVDNFKSEPAPDGQLRTVLRSTIEIYKDGADGQRVASMPFGPTPDLCRNHRRDYFQAHEFSIPQDITPGHYVMRLEVVDVLSQKVVTATRKFTVR